MTFFPRAAAVPPPFAVSLPGMLSPSGVSPSVTVPREEFAHLEAPFLRTSGSRGLIDDAWQHLDAQLLDAPKDRLEQVLADSFNATYRKPHRRGASVVLSSSGSSSSAASVVSEARPLSLSSPSDGGDAHGTVHPGLAALAGSSIRPDESPFPARPLTPSGAAEAADLAWGERCAEFFNGGASSSEMLDVLAKSFSENYARPTKRQRRREPDQQTERQERRQERQERQEKKQEPLPVRTPTTSASQAASQPTVQPTVQTSSQPSERQSASREDHVAAALAPLTDAIAVAMSAPRPSASMAILQKCVILYDIFKVTFCNVVIFLV